MTRTVDFFFDLSSPYSYLAATQVDAAVARHGATARWRPVVLAAIFKAADNRMPAQSPPKARYMLADLARWAARYGVPFALNSRFPLNAMTAHRMICAARTRHGDAAAARLARALFDAAWAADRDITDAAVLTGLGDGAGLPGAALVAATQEQAVKDALRADTDEAIARGMFGAPTFVVGDELFFGNDRIDFVEAALAR